jgi:hypothetical protein
MLASPINAENAFADLGDAEFASFPADSAKLVAHDAEKWAKAIKFQASKRCD